jgi:hypothetical protein
MLFIIVNIDYILILLIALDINMKIGSWEKLQNKDRR